MIAVVDYGVGNLFSLQCSLNAIGAESVVTSDESVILSADRVILPGVGAFRDAAESLHNCGLDVTVKQCADSGKPLLGICLGMQLLFERSFEYGDYAGLGIVKGSVRPISDVIAQNLKIPHIGWNALIYPKDKPKSPLFKYINEHDCVYFVHSFYAADCDEAVIANTEYGAMLTAAVGQNNVFGCQFHPEKSGRVGLDILRAFCEIGVKNADFSRN